LIHLELLLAISSPLDQVVAIGPLQITIVPYTVYRDRLGSSYIHFIGNLRLILLHLLICSCISAGLLPCHIGFPINTIGPFRAFALRSITDHQTFNLLLQDPSFHHLLLLKQVDGHKGVK